MENRKVGIVWELNTYGGVQTCVIVLIQGLNKMGIRPILFCENQPSTKIKNEFNIDFDYEIINYFKLTKLGDTLFYIFRHLRTSQFKEVVKYLYVFDNDLINDISEIKVIRYISMPPFYYKSFKFNLLSVLKQFLQKLVCVIIPKYNYKNDYRVFINSLYTQGIFIENYGYSIDVVYPPSLMELYSGVQKNNKTTSKRKVVFFSRICKDKGIDIFIELARQFTDLDFILFGSVDVQNTEFFQSLESESEKQKNLFVYKNLVNLEIEKILIDCDFFVFTKEFEHFGIVTLDMIRMGLIPIVHNSGGQKEIVSFDYLRFNDTKELIRKINWLKDLNFGELELMRSDLKKEIKKFENRFFSEKFMDILK